MNIIERYFPGLALRYMKKRLMLETAKRTYSAAKDTRFRKRPELTQSGDAAMTGAGDRLRAWARHLDENHDLSIGVLDALVTNIVGTGLTVQPMVMQRNGKPSERINKQLLDAWEMWSRRPEVTGEISFAEVQRILCRTWLRDGEALIQHVEGTGSVKHLGGIPYSLELIEADYLPFDYTETSKNIIHGVQKDAWGRPYLYHLYKEHPGNTSAGLIGPRAQDLKQVRADRIIHLKHTRRIKQTRGVTVFHGVITRLDDLRDYEESERIAARIAASMTAYIKKSPDLASTVNADGDRTFEMSSGMVFDNLLPGEEIGTVEANRPNTGLNDFRNSMLRAVAAGTGASYSSISKDYNGTYSSQRQEMVEAAPAYRRMREYFISAFMRPVYEHFVDMAIMSGAVTAPKSLGDSIYSVDFGGVSMPWIDPKKESEAAKLDVEAGFKSRHQVIRERGYDPRVVDEQRKADKDAPVPEKPTQSAGEPVAQDENEDADAA